MTAWRPVVEWEGMYEVSDEGDVRRVAPSTRNTKRGDGLLTPRASAKAGSVHGCYQKVALCNGKVRADVKVHQLVAAAFIGPRPAGMEINHRDGNPLNNRPGNLEYVSHADNVAHGWRSGLRAKGTRISRADAAHIRAIARAGADKRAVAQRYGISPNTVRDIASGRSWRTLR